MTIIKWESINVTSGLGQPKQFVTNFQGLSSEEITDIPVFIFHLFENYVKNSISVESETRMKNITLIMFNNYLINETVRGFTLEEIQGSLQNTYPERFY